MRWVIQKYFFIPLLLLFITVPAQAYRRDVNLRPSRPKPRWARPTTTIENLQWDVEVKNLFYQFYMLALRDKKIPIDPPDEKGLAKKLNRILERLKPHALLLDLPLEVHWVDDPFPNATCLPGGGIIFFKGLFDPKEGLVNEKDEEEIAAVMAHEMAHATLRHGYQTQRNAQSIIMIGDIVSTGVGLTLGSGLADLFSVFYYAPLGIYLFKHSREQESQADLEGLYMMMRAGYNPAKMVTMWERAAGRAGKKDRHSIFSTHPTSGKRAKDLKEHLKNILAHEVKAH